MKVSIIIPIYNVEKYIINCINSVINQSYRNIEVILVDDCGTDSSMEKVNDFISKYNNDIKLILISHKKNKGLSAARNTGLKSATGDYIFFLDSDDTIPYNSIELLVDKVNIYNNVDFVIGGIETFGNNKIKYPLTCKEYINDRNTIINTYTHVKWNVMACNKLFRKQFLMDNNLFFKEGIYHEDMDYTFRVAFKANSMACCYNVTYNYLIRDNSLTTHKSLKNYEDQILIIKTNFRYFNDTDHDRTLDKDIICYFIDAIFGIILYLLIEKNKDITIRMKKDLINDLINFLKSNDTFHNNIGIISYVKLNLIFLPFSIKYPIIYLYSALRGYK